MDRDSRVAKAKMHSSSIGRLRFVRSLLTGSQLSLTVVALVALLLPWSVFFAVVSVSVGLSFGLQYLKGRIDARVAHHASELNEQFAFIRPDTILER